LLSKQKRERAIANKRRESNRLPGKEALREIRKKCSWEMGEWVRVGEEGKWVGARRGIVGEDDNVRRSGRPLMEKTYRFKLPPSNAGSGTGNEDHHLAQGGGVQH